jgi:hypothetical protein
MHTEICRRHRGEFLQLFAERIRRFECRVDERIKEWNMVDVGEAASQNWDVVEVAKLRKHRYECVDEDDGRTM